MRSTARRPGAASRRRRSRPGSATAAVIGPIVCELDGPMPILNRSKTDRNTGAKLRLGVRIALFSDDAVILRFWQTASCRPTSRALRATCEDRQICKPSPPRKWRQLIAPDSRASRKSGDGSNRFANQCSQIRRWPSSRCSLRHRPEASDMPVQLARQTPARHAGFALPDDRCRDRVSMISARRPTSSSEHARRSRTFVVRTEAAMHGAVRLRSEDARVLRDPFVQRAQCILDQCEGELATCGPSGRPWLELPSDWIVQPACHR